MSCKIVEDESHFMLHCKKDDILRVNLFQTLKDENEEFIELFEMEKIKSILAPSLVIRVIAFIFARMIGHDV